MPVVFDGKLRILPGNYDTGYFYMGIFQRGSSGETRRGTLYKKREREIVSPSLDIRRGLNHSAPQLSATGLLTFPFST